jgi:hypothetical protein
MAYTLDDLIAEANTVFPDGFILGQHQQGLPDLRPIEFLAQFIVAEVEGLYSPRSSDRENLSRIVTNLDITTARLEEVRMRFQELHDAALLTTP